ncbi:MAG: SufD family Fe-S cluster assembly protein, partial [Candidatus Latescibacteria bacterium]|nr:SufD family Fe-S cluster assembly protein [Candidatus Latescibacterota bacterium]
CDLEAKVYGKKEDKIRLKESIYLNGAWSRGLVKSRIVVSERAQSEVLGEIIGNGPHTRGHVDCLEIVQGNEAQAKAVPLLQVVDETAKLTHEAAIGSVDKKQVQTLMARGLTETEAVETVVRGLLK